MSSAQVYTAKPALAYMGAQRHNVVLDGILELRVGAIWRAMTRQSPAFWATFLYLFFEYVRPQSIYLWIDVAPWPGIFLFSAVALTALEGRLRFTARAPWLAVAIFTCIIIASSVTAQYPSFSWANKEVWINWLLLMLVVGAGVRNKNEFILHIFGFVLWNLKMSQHGVQGWVGAGFSFVPWGVSGAPGWFHNSGEFGIEMCVFLPIAGYLALGLWPRINKNRRIFLMCVIASALISIVASSSRGAFLGAACVAAWVVWRSPYRLRAIALVVPVIALTWLILPERNKERWRAAGQDRDSVSRLTYWKHGIEITKNHPVLGIGYRNWIPYYRRNYNPKGEVPHNYLVEAGSELGLVGLLAFIGMTAMYFRENARTRRRLAAKPGSRDYVLWTMTYGLDGAMIGFLSSGFFVTVLYYPYYWMNMALCMALARVANFSQKPRPH